MENVFGLQMGSICGQAWKAVGRHLATFTSPLCRHLLSFVWVVEEICAVHFNEL